MTARKRKFSYLMALGGIFGIALAVGVQAQGGWQAALASEPDRQLLGSVRESARALRAGGAQGGLALYLGDSVLFIQERWPQVTDPKLRLPAMVSAAYAKAHPLPADALQFISFCGPGFKAADFLGMGSALSGQSAQLRLAVIPLNLRLFSPAWNAQSRWQNPSLQRYLPLSLVLGRPSYLENGPGFASYALGRLDEAMAGAPGDAFRSLAWALGSWQRRGLAAPIPPGPTVTQAQERNYLFTMQPENPQLQASLDLGRLLRSRGVTPFFYATPLPVDEVRAGAGAAEVRLEENVALIVARLGDAGFEVADYHDSIHGGFFDPAVEHLSAAAMRKTAGLIARDLGALMAAKPSPF